MFRRVFLLLFILINLTTQVSVAFACGMMGDTPVVMKKCCCKSERMTPPTDRMADGMAKGTAGGARCCEQIVEIQQGPGDQVGGIHSATQLPDYKPQPQPQPLPPALVPVLLSFVLQPAQRHELVWDQARDHGLYGTDLYLRTQRLRL